MKIKKIFTVIILVFTTNFSYAQLISQIRGELVDDISNLSVPYASISLMDMNDTLIAGTLSNKEGMFTFNKIEYTERMYMLIRHLAYSDKRVDLSFNSTNAEIDAGRIGISPIEIQLNEFTIEKSPNYVENKFDRKVFNISEDRTAAARTILDLLRILPGVVVDDSGNIRYKGGEATIYVDDQLLKTIYAKIEMIPVDRVNKIELIDVAMQTGGKGIGGIINIKFKPINSNGLSGMLSANAGTTNFNKINHSNEFLNLNYKNNKFLYFINSTFENTNQNTQTTIERNINLFELPSIQNTHSRNIFERFGNYNYIGTSYNPSQNTKLYFSYYFLTAYSESKYSDFFLESNRKNEKIMNEYTKKNNSDDNQFNTGINLSYWHKMDSIDTYIKMNGGFEVYNMFNNGNWLYNYHTMDSQLTDSVYTYKSIRNVYSKSLYFNFFYNHSLSKTSRWNLSYNLYVNFIDSLCYKQYISDELYLPNSQFDTNLEQSHNLSFRIGFQWDKWKIDGGINFTGNFIHGNYLRYTLNEEDTVIPINKPYLKLLPSATIAFSINDFSEIKLSLSETTDFPYFLQLSDYIDKNSLYNWKSGNSNLNPVNFYSAYLSYIFNKEKWNTSVEFFFNYTNNEVENLSIPITSLIFLSRPENIAKKTNIGMDISLWYRINSKLNFSLSSTLFHTYFDTKALANTAYQYDLTLTDLIRKQFGYSVKYNMEYRIKKFYTMFYVNYYAKELTFNGYKNAYVNSSLNISKKICNDKLRITFGLNNIFDDLFEHGSYSNDFGAINHTTITGSRYKCTYNISIQYVFNQGDRGTKDFR
jgi:hypothetical protein